MKQVPITEVKAVYTAWVESADHFSRAHDLRHLSTCADTDEQSFFLELASEVEAELGAKAYSKVKALAKTIASGEVRCKEMDTALHVLHLESELDAQVEDPQLDIMDLFKITGVHK